MRKKMKIFQLILLSTLLIICSIACNSSGNEGGPGSIVGNNPNSPIVNPGIDRQLNPSPIIPPDPEV